MWQIVKHFTKYSQTCQIVATQGKQKKKWSSLTGDRYSQGHQHINTIMIFLQRILSSHMRQVSTIERFHLTSCCPPIWPSDCADWPGYPGQSRAPCTEAIIMHLNHEWRSSRRKHYAQYCKTDACIKEYWLPFAIEAAMLEDSMTSHKKRSIGRWPLRQVWLYMSSMKKISLSNA